MAFGLLDGHPLTDRTSDILGAPFATAVIVPSRLIRQPLPARVAMDRAIVCFLGGLQHHQLLLLVDRPVARCGHYAIVRRRGRLPQAQH